MKCHEEWAAEIESRDIIGTLISVLAVQMLAPIKTASSQDLSV